MTNIGSQKSTAFVAVLPVFGSVCVSFGVDLPPSLVLHKYIHRYIHTYIYIDRYLYIHIYIYTFLYVYIHMYMHTHIHTIKHMYTSIYTRMCVCIYVYSAKITRSYLARRSNDINHWAHKPDMLIPIQFSSCQMPVRCGLRCTAASCKARLGSILQRLRVKKHMNIRSLPSGYKAQDSGNFTNHGLYGPYVYVVIWALKVYQVLC